MIVCRCESEIVDMEKHLAVDGEELQDLILTLTQFVEALQVSCIL